jgi:hypothetical protein
MSNQRPQLREYGILTDDGDCLYGYDTLADLMVSVNERENGLRPEESIIRIDAYTVLAVGNI